MHIEQIINSLQECVQASTEISEFYWPSADRNFKAMLDSFKTQFIKIFKIETRKIIDLLANSFQFLQAFFAFKEETSATENLPSFPPLINVHDSLESIIKL